VILKLVTGPRNKSSFGSTRSAAALVSALYGLYTLAPLLHHDHADHAGRGPHDAARLIGPACDGGCADPDHHHGPLSADDPCVICRVLSSAPAAVAAVGSACADAGPVGRFTSETTQTNGSPSPRTHAARAPPGLVPQPASFVIA